MKPPAITGLPPVDFAAHGITEVWIPDCEWMAGPGERYTVLYLVARNFLTGELIRLRREEMRSMPPYGIGPNSLVVTFAAQAEAGCHLALGWPLWAKGLDLRVAYRRRANGDPRARGRGSLLNALDFYHLAGISAVQKDAARKRIMAGPPFTEEEDRHHLDYCQSDVDETTELLKAMLKEGAIDLPREMNRQRPVIAMAKAEYLGIMMDQPKVKRLLEPVPWERIRQEAIPRLDNYQLKDGSPYKFYDGSTFKYDRFEALLKTEKKAWPVLRSEAKKYLDLADCNPWEAPEEPEKVSGRLDMKRATFRSMIKIYPEFAPIYELRHHLSQMRKLKLKVGHDGRCRTPWWAFSSKTSRFQPKATEQPFGHSTWVRSLMTPGPGWAFGYIDFNGAEFGIAGARSNCPRMLEVYQDDPYLGSAIPFGMAPAGATKATHYDLREMFKVALLAIQYGMQYRSLALRLNISEDMAREMIGQHHWNFPEYWDWTKRWLHQSFTSGMMWSEAGWTMSLERPITERTARNWPIQTTGAELFRLALLMADRLNIQVVAPVHDAVLIQAREANIETEVARIRYCMERASRVVLKRLALRTDYVIIKHPDRYVDKRGVATWEAVAASLAAMEDPFAEGVSSTVTRP